MTNNAIQVTVTEQVYDLFLVDILNQTLLYESFEYAICSEDNKTIRKGQFRAPSVQLRTSDLCEGNYQFQLYLKGKEWQCAAFQKVSHPAA
ncbi:MAG: hypothetical protein JWQ96_458 [Segetibacter sp.]|nr:hypothetical protein [Segetibacter sp.]